MKIKFASSLRSPESDKIMAFTASLHISHCFRVI